MNDEQYLQWLMFVTRELMAQRSSRKTQDAPTSNAGPRYHEANTFTVEDEGFSRWMGWRGPDAQDQETAWPAAELKAEREERHMRAFKQLRQQNAEFRQFLVSLRKEIDRRLGEPSP